MLLLLLPGALLNVDATQLSYFDPQGSDRTDLSYRRHGAGSIPRELGEKLLTQETHALGADSLIVIANQEYSILQRHLRALLEERWGIAEEYDSAAGAIPKPKEERSPYLGVEYPAWPPLGEGLSVFNDIAKQDGSPREYQLTSKPYNRLESFEGYSEVRIRITDGKSLLGKDVTIFQVRRRDYSKERARLHHSIPIPLPYKEYLAFTVVTDTEVALIEQLKQRIPGLVVRYFVPGNRMREKSYLEDFLASLRRAAMAF